MELKITIASDRRNNFLPDFLIPPVARAPFPVAFLHFHLLEFVLLLLLFLPGCLVFLVHLLGLLQGLLATFAAGHGACTAGGS